MKRTKRCSKCGKIKPIKDFYKKVKSKDGLNSWCKTCVKERQRIYCAQHRERERERGREQRAKHPEYMIDYHLRQKYNISLVNYGVILEAQDNGCAICGKTPEENGQRLAVDHDHETGKVRGLLCIACNRGLGYFQDNVDSICAAADYLILNQERDE